MAQRNRTELTDPRPRVVLATTLPISADCFYRGLIREFGERGYAVHVVTGPGPQVAQLGQRADAVHEIPMAREVSLRADAIALFAWIRLLRRIGPTLVIAGTPKASLLALLAARLTRVPQRVYFLLGLRLEGASGMARRIFAVTERLTSACAHRVIAVSPSLASAFRHAWLNVGREVTVPLHGSSHGVDSEHFAPQCPDRLLRAQLGLDPHAPVIGFIGRLTRDKGPDALIGATRHLQATNTHVQILVVGPQDEPDSAHYVATLSTCGVPVTFVDHTDDVRPYLSLMDVFVLPTWREGMPNVALEAAACGLPVITTRATGAVDSVVHEKTGLVVPVDDPDALAMALRRLINDPHLAHRMGVAGRERVRRDFQPGAVATAVADTALSGSRDAAPSVRIPTSSLTR